MKNQPFQKLINRWSERLLPMADFVSTRLLIIFFFAILIIQSSREVADLDLWLHLKTGEVILRQGAIPLADIFSYSMFGKPWINHAWLFQVLAYLFYSAGSADGIILMQNMVVVSTFLLLFVMGKKRENYILLFVILYLTLLTVAHRFTIRPDIFSLLFLTLYLFIVKKFTQTPTKLIWALPLLQVFWTNMHGFFFLGPLVLAIVLISEVLKARLRLPYDWNNAFRLSKTQVRVLLLVLGFSILATLINPHGLKGALYPFGVLSQISGKGKLVFRYIQELTRPVSLKNVFNFSHFSYYKALILLSLFSFRFNQRRINIADLLLWIGFLLFSLAAVRNIAYFAILAAVVIFTNYDQAMDHGKKIPLHFPSKKIKVWVAYCFMVFLFYFPAKGTLKILDATYYIFETYQLKSSLWGTAESRYPKNAVDFLLKNNFPKTMFNDFNAGAYLVGKAYPQRRVFIDGRTELYGPEFFSDYVAFGEGNKAMIEKFMDRYDFKGCFLTLFPNDIHLPLIRYFILNPVWKTVYFDDFAMIILKDIPENASLIKRYEIRLQDWRPPEPNFIKLGVAYRFPRPYLDRARMLDALGFYAAAAREARMALEIMPQNGQAFKYLSNDAFDRKEYLEAYQYARNSLIFARGDVQMNSQLALIYHHLGEEEKALKVIDSVIKLYPKYSHALYIKALILKDKFHDQAKELLSKAILLSPKESKFHEALGDIYAQEAKMQDAHKEWLSASEYDAANISLKKKIDESGNFSII
ncbi:MAG: hypothetical protein V1863_00870 [Candidatus Omnitrophota bacterium]